MATDRNKTVQNYSLEELKYYNPDQSEIWIAKHKILKKNFTLKRVKFRANQGQLAKTNDSISAKQQWDYNNIARETNILKRLMCDMSPKCHKMIKTSNNIYVIYDQFPETTVKQYISRNSPNRNQKLSLMLQIAKTLNYFHTRSIILLYLSTANIYVKDKNTVFFSDWTLARTVESQEKINPIFITDKYENIGTELISSEKYSYWSDIYCLGSVFQKILRSGFLEQPSQIDKKIEQLISKMVSSLGSERPRLQQVIRQLQNYGAEDSSQKSKSPENSEKDLKSLKSISNFRIKHTSSTPLEREENSKDSSLLIPQKKYQLLLTPKAQKDQCPSPLFGKSVKSAKFQSKTNDYLSVASSRKIESKKSFEIGNGNALSYTKKKKQQQKQNFKQIIKIVNKKRNLAFFILQLAQFVLKRWVCPDLGYVLMKYSLLTLGSASEEWNKHQIISTAEKDSINSILAEQKQKISINLNFLKQQLQQNQPNLQLKKQFEHESQISQKFLKQKIVQFAKQMVIFCQFNSNQKYSLQKLVDSLFKTYMILKKIQQGSYERFWEKIYNNDYAFLQNQKYMKQQQHLGHRYLKSRIAQILRGK